MEILKYITIAITFSFIGFSMAIPSGTKINVTWGKKHLFSITKR